MGWVLHGIQFSCVWLARETRGGGKEQLAEGRLCHSEEAGDSSIRDREPQNGFNHRDEIVGLDFQKYFPGRDTKDDESEGCVI